jgi:protein dithiol oxidoreductase (disulfide-forming)
MKNTLKLILIFLTASTFFLNVTVHAQGNDPYAGKYFKIDPPQHTNSPRQVEIVELFWYTCPHCKYFDAHYLKGWLENWNETYPGDLSFRQMPAVFDNDSRIPLAKAFYVADALGVLEEIHTPLFEAIHDKKKKMNDQEALQKFFLDKAGISKEDFDETYDSFSVEDVDIPRAKNKTKEYGVDSVPTIIINGKYRLTSEQANGYTQMKQIIDYLIEKEREAMGL